MSIALRASESASVSLTDPKLSAYSLIMAIRSSLSFANSTSYWNEGGTDYSDGGPPCTARMVDVKITEASLPWFFGLKVVPAINAHACVRIETLSRLAGALPVAVPDIDPRVARAYFVNESTGAVITSVPLTKSGTGSGMAFWDNAATPV